MEFQEYQPSNNDLHEQDVIQAAMDFDRVLTKEIHKAPLAKRNKLVMLRAEVRDFMDGMCIEEMDVAALNANEDAFADAVIGGVQ